MGKHHPAARRKPGKGTRKYKRGVRDLKHRGRDIDQVHDDLIKGIKVEEDPDLPGSGKFYCVSCARHFVDESALKSHLRRSKHKRMLKKALQTPYTQADAESAAEMTKETYTKVKDS
eukprot:GHVN01005572.1.p1 GENE.GHVN01005572.1~~GHVN01005572.1.p1  ORF type:complete len:117 (-),score=19.49 GHVN01005572.1:399-749(-)